MLFHESPAPGADTPLILHQVSLFAQGLYMKGQFLLSGRNWSTLAPQVLTSLLYALPKSDSFSVLIKTTQRVSWPLINIKGSWWTALLLSYFPSQSQIHKFSQTFYSAPPLTSLMDMEQGVDTLFCLCKILENMVCATAFFINGLILKGTDLVLKFHSFQGVTHLQMSGKKESFICSRKFEES